MPPTTTRRRTLQMLLATAGLLVTVPREGGGDEAEPQPPLSGLPDYDELVRPEEGRFAGGAKGDGRADDAKAIRAMMDYVKVNARQFNVIRVAWGEGKTYLIGSVIEVQGANHWHFAGNRAALARHHDWNLANFVEPASARPGGRMMILRDCHAWSMYDFTFDGRRATSGNLKPVRETHHSLQVQGGSRFKLFWCNFLNGQGDGLQVTRNGVVTASNASRSIPSDYEVISCVFDNNFRNGVSNDYGKDALWDNCAFQNSNGTAPSAGVDIEPLNAGNPFDGYGAENHIFRRCLFRDNAGSAFMISGDGISGRVRNIEVDSCRFYGGGTSQDERNRERGHMYLRTCEEGIHVHDSVFRDMVTKPLQGAGKHLVFMQNTPFAGGQTNIGLIFERNDIAGCSGAEHTISQMRLRSSSRPVIIRNNTIDVSDGLAVGEGIEAKGPAAIACLWPTTVLGNKIIGNPQTTGIAFDRKGNQNARPEGAVATDNEIIGHGIGIEIRASVGPGHGIVTSPNLLANTVNVKDRTA